MIKIAITGGIGSGKSKVCYILEHNGYDIFYSDVVAKKLVNINIDLKKEIIDYFGEESFINDIYNSKYISNIVFKDKEKLDILNKIFKKYILLEIEKFTEGKDLVFFESAIIFENKREKDFDYIVCVYADESIVIDRIKKRDDLNDIDIQKRLDNQLDPKIKRDRSDFIIYNNGYENLDEQIYLMLKNIMKLI